MRIRLATPLDSAGIGAVDALVRGADLDRATLVEDAVHGRRDSLCLVAAAGDGPGAVAGYTVLRRGHLLGRDQLALLHVAPAARRQGIGSALVRAAVAASGGDRVLTAAARSDTPVRALLAGLGWRVGGRLTGVLGPDPADDVVVLWTTGAGAGAPPAPGRIYHLALREDWDRARRDGEYRISTIGRRLEQVGFVHASFAHQLAQTARTHYAGVDAPLVLLVVDRSRLGVPVRVEAAADGDEMFPHVYGPVPVAAVLDAPAVRRDAAGHLLLPPLGT